MSSIRVRLTLWYALILGVILALFSWMTFESVKNRLNYEVSRSLQSIAFEAVRLFDPSSPTLSSLPKSPSTQNIFVLTYNRPGRLVESSHAIASSAFDPSAVATALNEGKSRASRVRVAGFGELVVYTVPVIEKGEVVGAVQAARSLASYRASLRELRTALFVLVPLCLALATAGGLFMSTKALAPIERISETAKRITSQNLDERVPISGRDELADLAETINDLLDRLKEAIESERRFIDDASHELRTPITVLRGEIEVALRRDRDPEEYKRLLANAVARIEELSQMVDGLLTLARLGKGAPLNLERINALELLFEAREQLRKAFRSKKMEVTVLADEDLWITGDRVKLRQLIVNLLDNAIKFAPSESKIELKATREPGSVALSVKDAGPGISEADLPRIFERFYRGSATDGRAAPGSGIGLSVAKLIAEAHGGKISVSSKPGEGSEFILRLPARDNRQPQIPRSTAK